MIPISVLALAVGLLQAFLLGCLLYQLFWALASLLPRSSPPPAEPPHLRFAVAIPAHDESLVLPATLARLKEQSYPSSFVDIHVVADYCTDDTAQVTSVAGAIAHERNEGPTGRKAYPLQWLVQRLLEHEPPYHAIAVFDADSLVDADFLSIVERHLRCGRQVVQGQHVIQNPHDSRVSAMAAVDMRLNNRLRNLGRSNLGFACRLMGDAMVFDTQVLRERGWPTATFNEDREFGYELLLRGVRAYYVPEALSYGQAASSWHQAEPQRLRWYRQVPAMQRRLAWPLIAASLRSRSLALLDGAIELLMPPYSMLTTLAALNLAATLVLSVWLPAGLGWLGVLGSACLLAGWILYPVLGLVLDRAPRWAFRALLLGPVYLLWRLWIALLVRVRGDRIAWQRTQRREETNAPR